MLKKIDKNKDGLKIRKSYRILLLILIISLLSACAKTTEVSKTPAAPSLGNGEAWDMETEFLIIGGGVSGLSAAVEAADLGVEKVLVIEKLAVLGGSAFVSEGILGGHETQITKSLDIHVDPQDIYEEQMREKKYNLDPELTWLTVEQSGKTIDWLIDTIGAKFQPDVIIKDGYGTLEAMHIVEGNGPGLRAPYNEAIAKRPAIEILTETRAIELISDNGVVIGAIAQQGNKSIRIKADAVMLATGGYNSNYEIITNTHPANKVFQTSIMPGSTGDGLLMATSMGAGTNNLDQIQCYLREYENPTSQTGYLYNIYVGSEGKRFMDEKRTPQTYNQENRDAIIEQTGKDGTDYFWAINDHASMVATGIAEKAPNHAGVFIADTLEELAKDIGVDAVGLKATVDHWNSMVEKGVDEDFDRTRGLNKIGDGPYYALKTTFFSSVCHGGITKNAKSEVTKLDGNPIPGLYASGELTAVTNSNGYTISNAITFGRIAAKSAKEYMKSK